MQIKKSLIRKVAARYTEGLPNDWDMVNLFPNRDPVEDMEDAYEGDTEVMPKKTLRNRYMQQPLMLRPEYKGDILEQLKIRKPGIRPENIMQADDQTNLKDFSDPEEMLKHQEEPYPRVVVDDFIQFDTPDPGRGNQTLKDYDDRGWEKEEAPEMSEDLIDRFRGKGVPRSHPKNPKLPVRARRVAMSFINQLIYGKRVKTAAMTLEGLKRSRLNGKIMHIDGVAPAPIVDRRFSDPQHGLWTFKTGKGAYTTTFEFVPEEGKEQVRDLKVNVNCSCPSWLWWGGLFNAFRNEYLYGPIHFPRMPLPTPGQKKPAIPLLIEPKKRDPGRQFLACKHMIACIPFLADNKLLYAPKVEEERKLSPEEIVEIEKGIKDEDLRTIGLPPYLSRGVIENQQPVKGILRKWKTMPMEDRDTFIKELESPAHLLYMGYRFPASAARPVLDQLTIRGHEFPPGWRARFERAKAVFKGYGDQVRDLMRRRGVKMAADTKEWDEDELNKAWLEMSEDERKKYVNSIKDPAGVYSVFLMSPKHSLGYVLVRLRDMLKDSKTEKEAEEYLRHFL